MNKITFEAMKALNNADLSERMDAVLRENRAERLGRFYNAAHDLDPYTNLFFRTAAFQSLPANKQRRALWKTFDFIMQMEFVRDSGGVQNSLMSAQAYDATRGWVSSRLYLGYLAQTQATIVGARIALERFMDLTYYVANGAEISSNSSKFGKFSEWIIGLPTDHNWTYLVFYLPWLRRHDVDFRTAEVHSGSKLKKYLASMQDLPADLQNEHLDLTNILMNLWRYVLALFEGARPTGASGTGRMNVRAWVEAYAQLNLCALRAIKQEVIAELAELES